MTPDPNDTPTQSALKRLSRNSQLHGESYFESIQRDLDIVAVEYDKMVNELNRAKEGWREMTRVAGELQLRHLDNHEGDVYHAMQSLIGRYGMKSMGPFIVKKETT